MTASDYALCVAVGLVTLNAVVYGVTRVVRWWRNRPDPRLRVPAAIRYVKIRDSAGNCDVFISSPSAWLERHAARAIGKASNRSWSNGHTSGSRVRDLSVQDAIPLAQELGYEVRPWR